MPGELAPHPIAVSDGRPRRPARPPAPHPLARARDRRRLVAGHPAGLRAGAVRVTGPTTTTGGASRPELNGFEQLRFLPEVGAPDRLGIHVLHAPSPQPDALAARAHPRLAGIGRRVPRRHRAAARPAAHGGDPADAFHVVCPSLPGLRVQRQADAAGVGRRPHRRRVGRADGRARLRPLRRPGRRLGLGGDDRASACHHADRCVGIHLNMVVGRTGQGPAAS